MATANKKTSSIIFILIGVVLVFFAWKLSSNGTNKAKEAEGNYVEVNSNSIDKNNDGKLVVFNGKMKAEENAVDQSFGISVAGAKLVRKVEVYQWVEECGTDVETDKKTCSYDKEWRSDLVDSSAFDNTSYSNPKEFPYENTSFYSKNVKVGAFTLPEDLLARYTVYKDVDLAEQNVNSASYEVSGDYITNAADISHPYVGDVRISYSYTPDSDVTVLAKQTGSTVEPYRSNGIELFEIKNGILSGSEMIETVKKNGSFLRWAAIIVSAGFILMGLLNLMKRK